MRLQDFEETAKINGMSIITVKKYVSKSLDDLMPKRPTQSKRPKEIDNYSNIVYKMLKEKIEPIEIIGHLKKKGIRISNKQIYKYIEAYGKSCFNLRFPPYNSYIKKYEYAYPDGVIVIPRNKILQYLTTLDPKKKKDKVIRKNIGNIRKKYPIVIDIENIIHYFSNCLKSNDTDNLSKFIIKYEYHYKDKLKSFIKGIKMDINAINAAITTKLTSGYVEGGNNKIKLIKRTCYGRLKPKRLSLRCRLAFN